MAAAEIGLDHRGILHDLLRLAAGDRKSTRLNSSNMSISYAVFCLKKKIRQPPQACALTSFAVPLRPRAAGRADEPPVASVLESAQASSHGKPGAGCTASPLDRLRG